MAKYSFGEIAINQMNNRRKLEEEQKQFNEKMAEETRQANLLTAFRNKQLEQQAVAERNQTAYQQASLSEEQRHNRAIETEDDYYGTENVFNPETKQWEMTQISRKGNKKVIGIGENPYAGLYARSSGGGGNSKETEDDEWDSLRSMLGEGYNKVKNAVSYTGDSLGKKAIITDSGKKVDVEAGIKLKDTMKGNYQKAFFTKIGKAGYRSIVTQFRNELKAYYDKHPKANIDDAIGIINKDFKANYNDINPKVIDNIALYFKLSKL